MGKKAAATPPPLPPPTPQRRRAPRPARLYAPSYACHCPSSLPSSAASWDARGAASAGLDAARRRSTPNLGCRGHACDESGGDDGGSAGVAPMEDDNGDGRSSEDLATPRPEWGASTPSSPRNWRTGRATPEKPGSGPTGVNRARLLTEAMPRSSSAHARNAHVV